MTKHFLDLDSRLGLDKYNINEGSSHITVDQTSCQVCAGKPCLTVCPAKVYQQVSDQIAANFENCLECGTCQLACDDIGEGGLDWRPPDGGFGIIYRFG